MQFAKSLTDLRDLEISYGTSEDKPPKFVQQYILGEKLGEGAYGKVCEAIDSKTLRRVAIKTLKKKQLRKIKGGEESIRNEISIMRRMRHKNVLELVEVINDDEKDKMYIVLEFAGAGSLQQLIDSHPDKRLPLFQVRSFFVQLIDGLEYIHNQGIIHRDIKPGNLMITPDGILKISDFGVAEELDKFNNSDVTSRSLGSPAFQPPQIAAGSEAFSGFKLDTWAVGVTLYYLVIGQLPFQGNNVCNLFENIAKATYTIPDWVKEPLRGLIQGMLDPNENTRFSLQQIKDHQWVKKGDSLESEGTDSSSNTTASRMSRANSREFSRNSMDRSRTDSPSSRRNSSHYSDDAALLNSSSAAWTSFSILPYIAKVVGSDSEEDVHGSVGSVGLSSRPLSKRGSKYLTDGSSGSNNSSPRGSFSNLRGSFRGSSSLVNSSPKTQRTLTTVESSSDNDGRNMRCVCTIQ